MAASLIQGRTFLITGSTDGIGRHTATKLAREWGKVLIHGRNSQKVNDTVKEIQNKTGNKEIYGYVHDLSSMQEVHELAAEIRRDHDHLDVLINNAGVFAEQKKITVDGFESTWAINVLAPYILQCRLLDMVKSRLINVSSISAANRIDFDNLQQEKGYSAHNAYSQSKLCMMMLTFPLAERLKTISNMTVNCLDPGTVNTKMLKAGWGSFGLKTDEADDEYYLATSSDVTGVSGEYFIRSSIANPPSIARDASSQERLWKIIEEQTGIVLDLSILSAKI